MPQILLRFPQAPTTEEASEPANLSIPTVALEFSFVEKVQDWYNYHFRNELAQAAGVHREMWLRGITEEIHFWDGFLRTQGYDWPDEFAQRCDPDLPLQWELAHLVDLPAGAIVRILDVGAGPFTWVGRKSPKWNLEIVPIDPLADAYDQLFLKYGLTPPVRTLQAPGEGLLRQFARNTFDIATARNSLDHAIDPADVIRQMVAVARPGGVVYLAHNTHEATNNAYTGLHQWDFTVEDGDFVIVSQVKRVNITHMLRGQATVTNWMPPEENWVNTTIRKHK